MQRVCLNHSLKFMVIFTLISFSSSSYWCGSSVLFVEVRTAALRLFQFSILPFECIQPHLIHNKHAHTRRENEVGFIYQSGKEKTNFFHLVFAIGCDNYLEIPSLARQKPLFSIRCVCLLLLLWVCVSSKSVKRIRFLWKININTYGCGADDIWCRHV